MSASLARRLAKIEGWKAEKAWRKKLAHCNCRVATVANPCHFEEFEAEVNLPCPAHGFRNLGTIISPRPYGYTPGAASRDEHKNDSSHQNLPKIDELIALYLKRLASYTHQELEGDPDEYSSPRGKDLTEAANPCRPCLTSHGGKMTVSLLNLSKRAAKLERDVAERARRRELVNCICSEVTSSTLDPEETRSRVEPPLPGPWNPTLWNNNYGWSHKTRRVSHRGISQNETNSGRLQPSPSQFQI